jgi:hypothetical protein
MLDRPSGLHSFLYLLLSFSRFDRVGEIVEMLGYVEQHAAHMPIGRQSKQGTWRVARAPAAKDG